MRTTRIYTVRLRWHRRSLCLDARLGGVVQAHQVGAASRFSHGTGDRLTASGSKPIFMAQRGEKDNVHRIAMR